MDCVYDKEVVFTESFATKPARTFVVNTNAPLHSVNTNSELSSGVYTFPPDSQFPDRFILWRAIGQKLFLEERSLCSTVLGGSLCLDFSRTSILSGTSIALFDKNILCIVVPTQSSIHSFYTRLVYDPTEVVQKEVSSVFTQIQEKEFIVENHTSYQLTTNGHAFRASVILQPDLARVAYCMTEGQLVVVTMYENKYDKPEEVIFRESGFMKLLLGEGSSGGVSDVAGLTKVAAKRSSSEDMFYAIYRDGTLRAWNAETQRVYSVNVQQFDTTLSGNKDQMKSLLVKAYQVDGLTLLVVAVSSSNDTKFFLMSDNLGRINHLWTLVADHNESLLDFGLLHKNSGHRSLWALWNSMSTTNEYILKHVDVEISPVRCGNWRRVCSYSSQKDLSPSMSVSELKGLIFNSDAHPFDIVFRSVQVTCQGLQCECAHGDWGALIAHVESYLRSPEFDFIYAHRGVISAKVSSTDAQSDAEQKFFYSLASACEELERAARGPLGLFLLDMVGAAVAGVIQQDRFSVVLDGDQKLIDEVESCSTGAMEEMISVALGRAAAKEEDGQGMDDYEIINESAHNCTTMRGDMIVKMWSTIIDLFIESVSSPPEQIDAVARSSDMFSGSFVCGLVASKMQHVVQQRLNTARNLSAVVQLYAEDSTGFQYSVFDFPYLEAKLADVIQLYSLFDEQLSLKLLRDGAQVSLCSWFTASEGIDMVCKTAEVDGLGRETELPQFNEFLSFVVEAALQVLSPRSPQALLARLLTVDEKYNALMNLCSSYSNSMQEELRPMVTFYKAVAFCGLGKPLKAMTAFNTAASGVTDGNKALLIALNPVGQKPVEVNLGDYYVTALHHLQKHRHSEEAIEMARSAIASLPPGHECTSRIYTILFKHLMNQGSWCDALSSIIQNTDPELKRTTLRELISRMLHANDWKSIVDLIYGKLEEEVESILQSAARTQKVTASPHLFKLLYSFYMRRNDFESAARTQYEYAFVLRTQAEQTGELLRKRRDALAVASTLLDLLPEADRFLAIPQEFVEEVDGDEAMDTSKDITHDMIDEAMDDVIADELNIVTPVRTAVRKRMFILTAEKLCEEWVVANARVALLVTGAVPPCEPQEIVKSLLAIKNYDMAFDVCRFCDVSVSELLSSVTKEAIIIDADPPSIVPSWIQCNQRHTDKSGSCDHWSVVRGLLSYARHLWPCDSRPLRAITRTFLAHSIPVPYWLDAEYTERDVGGYLRCLIEYGEISHGLRVAATCVDSETKKITSIESRVCLPLTAITDLLTLGVKDGEEKLLANLNEKLRTHFKRVENFEKAAQLSH